MDTAQLLISMFIGCIGMGYIIYGRKQFKGSALVAGIALCVYPYFVHNLILLLLIGTGIMVVPFFVHD